MKKFFYLMSLALCMFMGVAALSSCGDDDLEPTKMSEDTSANTLSLTFDAGDCISTWTAYFDENDKCIKFLEADAYKESSYADEEWEWSCKDNPKYTRQGNTIIYDATDQYKGKSKDQIRAEFQRIVDEDAEE